MKQSDLEVGAFFTTGHFDIWKMDSFCLSPTCTLKNLETGQVMSFGINGLSADDFEKVAMPGNNPITQFV